MTRLPVRTGSDVHLADAFERSGCPLCRERARMEAGYLASILAESVNDVGFRRALDAGRGFCGRHSRAVLDMDRRGAGSLGAAILLRATLVTRLRDLEGAHGATGRSRARRINDAAGPPDCPACARVRSSDAALVASLVAMTEDARWAEAAAAAPFCLAHLVALMGRSRPPAMWRTVEARQLERLGGIRDRLEAFAHATAHDRRHLQTDDQRASVEEAAELLESTPPVVERRDGAGRRA